jgi:hypothetical protein
MSANFSGFSNRCSGFWVLLPTVFVGAALSLKNKKALFFNSA